MDTIKNFFKEISLEKQAELPEDKRKARIFNIFLATIWVITALNAVQNLYVSYTAEASVAQEYAGYNISNFASLLILGLIWLGHRWFPQLMRHIFIILMVVSAVFNFRLVDLNQLFVIFALPIMMAAFLIGPVYSFVYWIFILVTYVARFYLEEIPFTEDNFAFVGLIALLVIAVVAWLIARSLDKALDETRALNRELDQRVQDRTRQLADSLDREHTAAVRNKTILEAIADGVLVFDAKNQVMIANPAANLLAGRDLDTFNLTEFLGTIDSKAAQLLETWIEGQKPLGMSNVKFEWNHRTISANVAPVILAKSGAADVDAGNVMVLRDFTREAELEKAKTIFLGMISHELRTPMSAIKGYVSVLLGSEETLSDTGKEYLQTIDVSIKQLLSLANELIDLSRLESGEIELYREQVPLPPIIKQATKMVRQEFASRNLTLNIEVEENLPQLYMDKNRVLQILLNLLSNAYKYTPQGGATLRTRQDEDWVTIEVSDTGVGIKPSDQANMFSRFFRANDRHVQRAGGTGLGLNITKGLTELHGGTLTFTSQYGAGTTFQVTLPKKAGINQPSEPELEESYAYSTR
jgi:signal transduction histidine kinase